MKKLMTEIVETKIGSVDSVKKAEQVGKKLVKAFLKSDYSESTEPITVSVEAYNGGVTACDNCQWSGIADVNNGVCPDCGSELIEISPNGGYPKSASNPSGYSNVVITNTPAQARPSKVYPLVSRSDVILPTEEAQPAGWEVDTELGWVKPITSGQAENIYKIYPIAGIEAETAVKSLTGLGIDLDTGQGNIRLTKDDRTGRYLVVIEPNLDLAVLINNILKPYQGGTTQVADRMIESMTRNRARLESRIDNFGNKRAKPFKKKKKKDEKESCLTPGRKIRSNGQGRGLARGQGNGPIGGIGRGLGRPILDDEDVEGNKKAALAAGCATPGNRIRSNGRGRGLARGRGRGPRAMESRINNFGDKRAAPFKKKKKKKKAGEALNRILSGDNILDAIQEGMVSDWMVQTTEFIQEKLGLDSERSYAKIFDAMMKSKDITVGDSPDDVLNALFTKADIRQIKKNDQFEGKDERGKRDGTGPYKDSFRGRNGMKGQRKAAGEKCPKEDEVKEARSSTIRLSTMDDSDELLLTLDKNMGKLVAGLVTVTKLPVKAKAEFTVGDKQPIMNPTKGGDFKITDRFGNMTIINSLRAMEVLR